MSEPSHFSLFGLAERFSLDAQALEAAWRRLQTAVHPDRHAGGSDGERRLALQRATQVNEAYRVLRDPQRRGAYLCERAGVPLQAESNTAMPAAFLMQQMAWREALEDARAARGAPALAALRDEITSTRTTGIHTIAALLDEHHDPVGAAGQLRQLMFIDRLLEEIDLAEDALAGI